MCREPFAGTRAHTWASSDLDCGWIVHSRCGICDQALGTVHKPACPFRGIVGSLIEDVSGRRTQSAILYEILRENGVF